MWLLLVISLYFSVHTIKAGVPEIKIELHRTNNTRDSIICNINNPKLTLGTNFSVLVYSDNVKINNGSCSSNGKETIKSFQKKTDYEISSQGQVDKNMKKNITCKIEIDEHDKNPIECIIILENIREIGLGEVLVNGNRVETEAALQNEYYDTAGYYKYLEGEEAHIRCKSTTQQPTRLYLDYNTDVYGKITTWKPPNSVEIYMKLTKSHEGYIDCYIMLPWAGNRLQVIRLFLDTAPRTGRLAFQVNGLTLTNRTQGKNKLIYEYKYYDGENLTIQSDKDDDKYGDMDCKSNDTLDETRVQSLRNNKQNFTISTHLNEQKNLSLTCSVDEIMNYGNDDQPLSVQLNLSPNDFNYMEPYVKGLSLANVLLMYNSTNTTTTIYYGYYNETESFNLRCYSALGNPEWTYVVQVNQLIKGEIKQTPCEAHPVNRPHFTHGEDLNWYSTILRQPGRSEVTRVSLDTEIEKREQPVEQVNLKEATFSLLHGSKENKESANITCTSKEGKELTIKLIKMEAISTIEKPTERKTNTGGSGPNIMTYILIAVGILTLVLISIVVCVIVRLTKRKSQKQNSNTTDINYQNLPDHNEGPMATPSQWNESIYAKAADSIDDDNYAIPVTHRTVEDMYSKPLPKNQRNLTQPTNEEPAYATVGDLSPTYAQPLPKGKRFGGNVQILPKDPNELIYAQMRLKPANLNAKPLRKESLYAEVANKTKAESSESPYAEVASSESPYAEVASSESPYAEVASSESPYAEVASSESPYAEVASSESPYAEVNRGSQHNKYANSLNSNRYVNVNSNNEYAEPAYCEVNTKK